MEATGDESSPISEWDRPFSKEELQAIEAAFEAAAASCSPINARRPFSPDSAADDEPPKTRRRLPQSLVCSSASQGLDADSESKQRSGSFALLPCPRKWGFCQSTVKMRYPAMSFGGRIVYSRTGEEAEEAASEIWKLVETKKREGSQVALGLDIEWRPTFRRGVPQGKAAVMQICGDKTHCFVIHIIHSGIPGTLRTLLEDSTSVKVGVGINGDSVKLFHDYNVSTRSLEDLSFLANRKLGGEPKHWSLASLVEMLTCKQLLKPKNLRLGNWEVDFLSKAQLQYAATDAFASWYLYEALQSFPGISETQADN